MILLSGDPEGRVDADRGPEHTYLEITARALESLTHPFMVEGMSLVVEASAGLSMFPQDEIMPETLLQRADISMYVAKSTYTRVPRYDGRLDEQHPRKLSLLAKLRRAVNEGELVMHLQPAVDPMDQLRFATVGVGEPVRPVPAKQHPA